MESQNRPPLDKKKAENMATWLAVLTTAIVVISVAVSRSKQNIWSSSSRGGWAISSTRRM